MQNIKTDLFRKLKYQSTLVAQCLKFEFRGNFSKFIYFTEKNMFWLASCISPQHSQVS